ncbi:hypothetical protein sos41_34200 [Alphaproteobacteria bacterium SO-S41]|nr:hypothetical protein sos41_34200 [Alphaproteobacteria bacterium SO-S41]
MDEQEIELWPEGPPTVIEGVPPESDFKGPSGPSIGTAMKRNISRPTLTVFRPDPARHNGRSVIISPGGGLLIVAWQHEGVDVARWFAARGFTAFVLKYRTRATPADAEGFAAALAGLRANRGAVIPTAQTPRSTAEIIRNDPNYQHVRDAVADDGRRAIELVRARAKEWDIDPAEVGMIGFSAGAFLTMDVATDPRAAPLAFAAAIYGGETRGKPVAADAPPLFAVVAQDDRNLIRILEGLHADWSMADRPSALHVFSRGGHGFGMIRQGAPSDRWIDLLGDWLDDLKR